MRKSFAAGALALAMLLPACADQTQPVSGAAFSGIVTGCEFGSSTLRAATTLLRRDALPADIIPQVDQLRDAVALNCTSATPPTGVSATANLLATARAVAAKL